MGEKLTNLTFFTTPPHLAKLNFSDPPYSIRGAFQYPPSPPPLTYTHTHQFCCMYAYCFFSGDVVMWRFNSILDLDPDVAGLRPRHCHGV